MKTVLRKVFSSGWLAVMLLLATAAMQVRLLYVQRATPAPGLAALRDAPDGAVVDVKGMPTLGSEAADLVLIEFSDFECPFCRRHATSVFHELQERFVRTGRIRYVFANNALPSHPNAAMLATAALCAGQQDRYWPMHDKLFRDLPKTGAAVSEIASSLEIDRDQFERCLSDTSVRSRVEEETQLARKIGLAGTPGFALGRATAGGQVVVERLISGAYPLAVFEEAMEEVVD